MCIVRQAELKRNNLQFVLSSDNSEQTIEPAGNVYSETYQVQLQENISNFTEFTKLSKLVRSKICFCKQMKFDYEIFILKTRIFNANPLEH